MAPGGPTGLGSLADERYSVDMNEGRSGAAIALSLTFDCKYLLDLESVVHKTNTSIYDLLLSHQSFGNLSVNLY